MKLTLIVSHGASGVSDGWSSLIGCRHVLHIDANVAGHLGPPIVAGYKLEGLEAAYMSGDAHIVVLLDDTTP
jgi:hypothetical protein